MMRRVLLAATGRGTGWLFLSGLALAAALLAGLTGIVDANSAAVAIDGDSIKVEIVERNDSGITGIALVERSAAESRISVSVSGSGDELLPYLHRGRCDAYIDGASIPLAGTSVNHPETTTVDLTREELLEGGFVIDLHVAAGSLESLMNPATSVACGELRLAGDGEVTQPPVTGIGPFDSDNANWLVAMLTMLAAFFGLAGLYTRRVPRPVDVVEVNLVALQRLRGMFL